MKILSFRCICVLLTLTAVENAFSQTNLLDTTFGSDGKTLFSITEKTQFVSDLKLLADGGILVSGANSDLIWGTNELSFLIKLDSTGHHDNTFGTDGNIVPFIQSGYRIDNHRIQILADGKIMSMVTLYKDNAFGVYKVVLLRYNADGSLDQTFGAGGKAESQTGYSIQGKTLLITTGGKIVVGGTYRSPDNTTVKMSVLRFLSNGAKDTSFDSDGKVEIDFGPHSAYLNTLAMQSDGKLIAGGEFILQTPPDIWAGGLVRLDENGQLDISFGTNGKLNTSILGSKIQTVDYMTCLPDDRIVFTGHSYVPAQAQLINLAQVMPDGSFDSNFGSNGLVSYMTNKVYPASGLISLPDHKTVLTSRFYGTFFRFDQDGSFDESFGNSGKIEPDMLGLQDSITGSRGFAIQTDGKIVSVHPFYETGTSSGSKFGAVLRLNPSENTVSIIPDIYHTDFQLYPNPVCSQTSLTYHLTQPSRVQFNLYDQNGRFITNLIPAAMQNAGVHLEMLQLESNIPPGIYLLEMSAGHARQTTSLVKIRG